MRQELLNSQGVENCFHNNQGHKNSTKHTSRLFVFLCPFVALFGRRRSRRGGNRILAVELGNECARDIDTVGGVEQRH